MKKMYKLNQTLKMLFMVVFVGCIGTASAQLSGSYTVDNGNATGGTNFNSFLDFRNAIVTNGVNGPVTVTFVTDQTETSQISFSAITGASSTNTITIDGANKFLAYGVADAVVLMNGADYFTFKNLTVRNTSSSIYVQGFRFTNNADYNTVTKCTIEFSALSSGSTGGGAYVSFAATATALTSSSSTTNGSYNTISANLMRTTSSNSPGPTFGIVYTGNNSSYPNTAQNNTFTTNTIQNFYYQGIYMYYSNGCQVLSNDISRANSSSANCASTIYGIVSFYSYGTSRATLLDNNNLHDWPYSGATPGGSNNYAYAFQLYYNYGLNNTTNRFSVSNNSIKNISAYYSIYLGYSQSNTYWDLKGNISDNNDVSVGNSSCYQYGWTSYSSLAYHYDNNTIKNSDGGYYWYGIYNYNPQNSSGITTSIDNNIIENNKNAGYLFYGIECMYVYNSSSNKLSISNNTIRDNQAYGYYMFLIADGDPYYYGYPSYGYVNIQRNKLYNNKSNSSYGYVLGILTYYNYEENITDNLIYDNVGYYGQYAMFIANYNSGNYPSNYRQNTIRINGTLSSYTSQYLYGMYLYNYSTSVTVNGNITDINNGYRIYPFYVYTPSASNYKWDRNSYYIRGATSGESWYFSPTGTATSFSGWASNGFAGPNEKSGDPKWNSAATGDYRSNALMNQNNVPYNAVNPRDVLNVNRNIIKNDRGATESMLDIQTVSSNFTPNPNECSGFVASPTLTLKNNFLEPITGFLMGMSVNGVLVSTTLVTNTIAVGSTGTVTMTPYTFSKTGTQKVQYFLLDADDAPTNDSLTYTFNVKKAPGGGALSLNTANSAPMAKFDVTGKPDITTNGQKISYDLTPPATLGYGNGDYLGGFSGTNKWSVSYSAVTKYGIPVPASHFSFAAPTASSNYRLDYTPSLAFVDSMIYISIKVNDYILVCDTTYKRTVLVAPQGVPDFKIPTLICDKDEVYFENTSTVTSGALLNQWSFGTDATSPVYKFNGPGTYNVTLTVTTVPHGYQTSITKSVQVNEIPTADFKPTNACEGVAIKLTNLTYIGSGTLSYVWDFGDGSPTSIAVSPTKLYTNAGGYKVTLTASGNGCKNVITKNVYQFDRPKALFSVVSGTCENDLFEFKNSSTIAQGDFGNNWDFDDAGNKATVEEPKYDFLTPGVKNIKLEVVSEFGCTDQLTVPITVKAVSKSGFTFPFACSRTLTPFTNTTIVPAGETVKTTTWDFGDGFTSGAANPLKQWFSIGSKIVKLTTELNNGCKDEVSQVLSVGVQPLVNFQFADQCAGTEVQFTNLTSFTQGKVTYDWDFGDLNFSNEGSPRHGYTTGIGTQSFTVKLKASIAGGCADSLIKVININPLPTTCNFDLTRDYSTSLSAYKFTPVGTPTGIKYTWITGDGNTVSSTGTGASYSYTGSGKYCVTMIAENVSGCECSQTKCVTLNTDVKGAESMNNLISIFPNPTTGIFSVNLDAFVSNEMTINVYNAVGALVKTITVNTNTANVDLSEFANGVYVVKVIADNQVATKKITLNK